MKHKRSKPQTAHIIYYKNVLLKKESYITRLQALRFQLYLPVQNEQQNQSRQVSGWNVGFLLKAEEDHNHNQARDDVVTLSEQTNEEQ